MQFESLFEEMKKQVELLAKELLGDLMAAGKKDGLQFLERSKSKLEEWSHALADEKMTPDEFGFLLKSQKDLAEMNTLKLKGLSQAKIDQFKNKNIDLLINTAFKFIR